MTVALKGLPKGQELTANDVSPVVANTKYAQRTEADVSPVVANTKYAQRADAKPAPSAVEGEFGFKRVA